MITESTVEFTVATAPFARAAARADRLLPPRSARAGGVTLTASGDGVRVGASGEEAAVWGDVPAVVNVDGVVAVGRRALASTVASLDAEEVRVRVEGSRLAIRTGTARFALPLLDPAALGPVPAPPPVAGRAPVEAVRSAVAAVAGAASRDGLPLFGGVRLRSDGDTLRLAATDRFRLAVAAVPWTAVGSVDVLIPAGLLTEAVRMLTGPEVTMLAEADRLGLSWAEGDPAKGAAAEGDPAQSSPAEGGILLSSLALPFPDAQLDRLLSVRPECTVDVEAALLRAAVERAMPFAGPIGTVTLEAADGVVVVRGSDDGAGDSREEVKAEVTGSARASYQGRYLLDALRCFGGERVTLQLQAGIQPSSITAAADPADGAELRYLVVPLRPAP
ncbi:MAG: DNA polymerase III subunit beta [Hamadaea sp.]|uniref:DNA polymerase III subunit beta n=1 Tax=Hamadaea sp. TaxID=2024425 RepID=UPI001816AE1A|nr:DNA polymerase III subunit beta [Hamadaea sp.]NUT19114.1 DNA polymerase III subunit beta [Hamadaea sp.]